MSDKLSGGMVCFTVEGLTPKQTVDRLKERGIAASALQIRVRASFIAQIPPVV
jgi:selenocysteine lyase/cysteine desulfurase